MRIGTLQMFRQGVNSILDQQTQLAHTQNQLSTGKRIVNPSDDPIGSAQLIGLSESLRVTEQYQRNGQMARFRLEQERFGIRGVRPLAGYADIYPEGVDPAGLAVVFTGDYDAPAYQAQEEVLRYLDVA